MNASGNSGGAPETGTPAKDRALAETLVDDRELGPTDPDEFRHSDLVDQVASLATGVDLPANIAIYGPWGSGKSSLASCSTRRGCRHD